MISEELIKELLAGDKAAWDTFSQKLVQESLRMLPLINDNIVKQAALLHESSTQFYKDNGELVGHKQLVAETIEVIESENPGMAYDELLEKVAPRVKSILKISDAPKAAAKHLDDLDLTIGKL